MLDITDRIDRGAIIKSTPKCSDSIYLKTIHTTVILMFSFYFTCIKKHTLIKMKVYDTVIFS